LIAMIIIFHGHNLWQSKTGRTRFFLALGIPLVLGAVCLGWYNWVRFDSLFEFGLKYQLNYLNYLKAHQFFSTSYLPANLFNYFLNPFEIRRGFPFLRAMLAEEKLVFGTLIPEAYYPEPVTGMIYTSPFLLFAFVAGYSVVKGQFSKSLKWVCIMLASSALLAFTTFLLYFFGTMRFLADGIPSVAVFSLIGFWQGIKLFDQNRLRKIGSSAFGIILGIWTVAASLLLALSSTARRPIYIDPILMDWIKSILK
jgi:hypothetical protein